MSHNFLPAAKRVGFIIVVIGLTGCAPLVDFFANLFFLPNKNIRPSIYQVETQRRVEMMMRDNVTLRADVHHPMGMVRTPTILVRIP